MGMSASQARLLSLTARLSDLEYEAQCISNSKIRLADASYEASADYEDALDKQKLQVQNSENLTYVDASAYNLTTYNAVSTLDKQRFIEDTAGRVLISSKTQKAFDAASSDSSISKYLQTTIDSSDYYGVKGKTGFANITDFMDAMGIQTNKTADDYDADKVTYYTNLYNGKEDFLNSFGYTSATLAVQESDENYGYLSDGNDYEYDKSATNYYSNIFDRVDHDGFVVVSDENFSSTEWLYNQLSNGNIYLSEWSTKGGNEGKGGWEQVSYATGDTTIQSVSDQTAIAKAEAEYNTTMAQIEAKDSRFDLALKGIDTEHSAIQTEIDSVKKVIDKNIERTFKIFDA